MTRTILGLDVGGANLKAATPDGRAVSVPFALWKQPEKLPAALAELVGLFPDVGELAVTMTGELCDCYETKRQGVSAILDAVEFAASGRPVRVWGTGGEFLTTASARTEYMSVAAANWHATATFAGRWVPNGPAILIDAGSTTTDVIRLHDGRPRPKGLTDATRLASGELIYTGARRTPVCALISVGVAAELFATTHDVYLVLGSIPESLEDTDTADGRPATKKFAHARLSRMLGGDPDTTSAEATRELAVRVWRRQTDLVAASVAALYRTYGQPWHIVLVGSGEFIVYDALPQDGTPLISFSSSVAAAVSACAPAYAVAVLASERPL